VSKWIAVGALVVGACCTLAFLALDPIVAAFVTIVLGTGLVIAYLARDWDRHSTYEQREQARTVRRQAKWEARAAVRERDRVRWEAHQARQAKKQER
jgi:membrane protein implicated in regulation of membrane protease activity